MTETAIDRRRRITQDAGTGLGISQPRHIQRMNGRFTLITEAGESINLPHFDQQIGAFVNVIVIDANPKKSKMFYDGPYDANRSAPPACWSDNGIGPSINALRPQAPTCQPHVCPQAKVGSAISPFTGQPVSACRDKKKLAVVVAGQQGAWLLDVPAASLRKFRDYIDWVVKQKHPDGNRQCDISDLITQVYYEQGKPNVLEFRSVGFTTPAINAFCEQVATDEDTGQMVGLNDVPLDAAQFAAMQQIQQGNAGQLAGPAPGPAQAPMPVQQAAQPSPSGAPAFALPGVPPSTSASAPQTAQAPSPAPKKPGRPKKEGGAPALPADKPKQGGGAFDLPAFMQPQQPAAQTGNGQPQFGIQQGQAPNQGMQDAVNAAFNLPTD